MERHSRSAHILSCRVTSVRSPCRRASKPQGKNAPPAQLAELQKRNEHRDPTTVRVVDIRAELDAQKALLGACFEIDAKDDEGGANQSRDGRLCNRRRQQRQDKPRVDRMPHHAIGAGVDDAMVLLAGDLARPQPSQVDARPPGETESGQHHDRERVGTAIANGPDWFFAEHLRRQRDKENAPDDHHGAVSPCVQRADPALGATRPERCRDPATKPDDPDDFEYGAWTTHHDPDASWIGRPRGAARQPATLHRDPSGLPSIASMWAQWDAACSRARAAIFRSQEARDAALARHDAGPTEPWGTCSTGCWTMDTRSGLSPSETYSFANTNMGLMSMWIGLSRSAGQPPSKYLWPITCSTQPKTESPIAMIQTQTALT